MYKNQTIVSFTTALIKKVRRVWYNLIATRNRVTRAQEETSNFEGYQQIIAIKIFFFLELKIV